MLIQPGVIIMYCRRVAMHGVLQLNVLHSITELPRRLSQFFFLDIGHVSLAVNNPHSVHYPDVNELVTFIPPYVINGQPLCCIPPPYFQR